jgi:hypothetical protein
MRPRLTNGDHVIMAPRTLGNRCRSCGEYSFLVEAGCSQTTKDLVDVLLIARSSRSTPHLSATPSRSHFGQREQQSLPANLPPPPANWREPYRRLATEVDVEPDLDKAFASAADFLDPVLAGLADGEWDPPHRRWA